MAQPHRLRASLRHRRGRELERLQRRCHHGLTRRFPPGKRDQQSSTPTLEDETTVQRTKPAPSSALEGSRLLRLPAELRNRIYELVLIDSGTIEVLTSLKRPRLLDTCRQIRQEALQLWYSENTFLFTVDSCDGVLVNKLPRHACALPVNPFGMRSQIQYTGLPNWKNLLRWAKVTWGDKRRFNMTIAFEAGGNLQHSGMVHMITAVHCVIDEMMKQPWEEVNSAIEGVRTAVRPYTTAWDATA